VNGLLRKVLLWCARNAWLGERLPNLPFMKRAVHRFMPGEEIEDALGAAVDLQVLGIGTLYTKLGEATTEAAGAQAVADHYLELLKRIKAAEIDGANSWQRFIHITFPMMRNIIAITVLFSLIVTFANFDIVQIMTAGGPRNMTHMFATYAFLLGISSGDIPLGSSVSLFMFPILAVSAVFILRGVRKRGREIG